MKSQKIIKVDREIRELEMLNARVDANRQRARAASCELATEELLRRQRVEWEEKRERRARLRQIVSFLLAFGLLLLVFTAYYIGAPMWVYVDLILGAFISLLWGGWFDGLK